MDAFGSWGRQLDCTISSYSNWDHQTRSGRIQPIKDHPVVLAEPVLLLRQAEGLTVLAGAGLVDGSGGYGDACGSWTVVLPLGVRHLFR